MTLVVLFQSLMVHLAALLGTISVLWVCSLIWGCTSATKDPSWGWIRVLYAISWTLGDLVLTLSLISPSDYLHWQLPCSHAYSSWHCWRYPPPSTWHCLQAPGIDHGVYIVYQMESGWSNPDNLALGGVNSISHLFPQAWSVKVPL